MSENKDKSKMTGTITSHVRDRFSTAQGGLQERVEAAFTRYASPKVAEVSGDRRKAYKKGEQHVYSQIDHIEHRGTELWWDNMAKNKCQGPLETELGTLLKDHTEEDREVLKEQANKYIEKRLRSQVYECFIHEVYLMRNLIDKKTTEIVNGLKTVLGSVFGQKAKVAPMEKKGKEGKLEELLVELLELSVYELYKSCLGPSEVCLVRIWGDPEGNEEPSAMDKVSKELQRWFCGGIEGPWEDFDRTQEKLNELVKRGVKLGVEKWKVESVGRVSYIGRSLTDDPLKDESILYAFRWFEEEQKKNNGEDKNSPTASEGAEHEDNEAKLECSRALAVIDVAAQLSS